MGSLEGEPTETQKEEVGRKCFGGGKPGEPNGNDHPSLPKEVENCLQSAMGDGFKTKSPDKFSEDEREKANSCFGKHNFQPQGGKPGDKRPPNMSDETMKCVEKVSGKSSQSRDFDDETKGKIDKECFGGRGGPDGQNRPNGERPPSPKFNQDSKSCEDRVAGEIKEQLPREEVEKRINEQCYKGERFGESPKTNDRGNGPPPLGNNINPTGPPPEGEGFQKVGPPEGNTPDDGGQYCRDNPSACQNYKPE